MPDKAVFCTLATGAYYDQGGTANLVKSARKFHPDVPFVVFGDSETKMVLDSFQTLIANASLLLDQKVRPQSFKPAPMDYYHALLGMTLCSEYDLVIYIDCDSLITAPLDEVFNQDYDIAGVRNMADNGMAGGFTPVLDGGLALHKYVNAGFTACRRKDFWGFWALLNDKFDYKTPLSEQYTLNLIFHGGVCKSLLLDPIEANVYYGVASTYGTKTHWDSWKNITIEDNCLKLDNRTIKVLHEGGGPYLPKMDLRQMTPHVRQWIKENILEE